MERSLKRGKNLRILYLLGVLVVEKVAMFYNFNQYISRAGCNMHGFCMSRINKIYISPALEKFGTNVEIIAGSAYSDHMPVKITLEMQRRPPRDCNVRINKKLFEDVEVSRNIRRIWESNSVGCGALDKLRGKIIETSTYLHKATKSRITRSNEEEMCLRRSIAAAQRLLQKDP